MTVIESPQASYQLVRMSWNVPSATEPGKTYTVTVWDNRYSCTCTAGHYKRLCWHRKAVQTGQVTSKPRVRIRPLEATVVAAAPAPEKNPAAFLYEA